MADVLESLIVKLALDGSDYNDNLQKAQGSLDGFASGAKDIGGKLTLGVTTPLVGIGLASINAASDLNESMSKVDVVFGQSAKSIDAWAASADTGLGASQQQALEAAGTFGNLFTTLGLSQDQSAGMSKSIVQLAADLASFNNIPIDEALQKLQSGLVGEAEPLRSLGVNISAAAIEQEAFTLGLAKQGDVLTSAQKTQASYALIMAQTTTAQGDFARTSDGLANSQRIMQAELTNTSSELGKELLPVALEVVDGLKSLLGWFHDLSPETKHWVVIIGGVAAAAGPVLLVLGGLASGISAIIAVATAAAPVIAAVGAGLTLLTGPIGLIVLAIAGLALAWNSDFGGIREKTQGFWNWLTGSVSATTSTVQSDWSAFTGFLQSDNQTKLNAIQSGWSMFTGNWKSEISGALDTVKGFWQNHSSDVQGIENDQFAAITGIFQTQIDLVKGILTAGTQAMNGDWSGALGTLKDTANTVWSDLQGLFQTGLDTVKNLFSLAGFPDVGENIAKGIASGVTSGLHWIEDAAKDAARAALDAAKWILGIHSPSAVGEREVGMPLGESFGTGAIKAMPAATAGIQSAINSMMSDFSTPSLSAAGAGTGGNTITINIYASDHDTANQAETGVLAGLRRAGLR